MAGWRLAAQGGVIQTLPSDRPFALWPAMSTVRVTSRPDLRHFFGPLSAIEHDLLLDRLVAIDERLVELTHQASAHVGVPYRAWPLTFSSDGGLAGGPSGDAGDIWFDVSRSWDPAAGRCSALPWIVESRLVVFCRDSPESKGDSNCHDLFRLEATADSPGRVIEMLETHVAAMFAALQRYSREAFTDTPHAELP